MAVSGVQNNDILIKKQELTRINNNITQNDGAIQQNGADVTANDGAIQTNTSAQSETSSNISNVSGQIQTVQGNKTGVQSEIASVQASLNGMSEDDANYSELSGQLDSLNMSLSDLEQMETELNSQKSGYEATLSDQQQEGEALNQTGTTLAQKGQELEKTGNTLKTQKTKKEQEIAKAEQEEKQRQEKEAKENKINVKGQTTVLANDATSVKREEVLPMQMRTGSSDGSDVNSDDDYTAGQATASFTADRMGEVAAKGLKLTKTAKKVVGNVGSAFDAGLALYQYSQGDISGAQAAQSTAFAAADVALNYVPYVGPALSVIGSENLYNESVEMATDYAVGRQKSANALKKGDLGTAAAGVIQHVASTSPLVAVNSVVYGAIERKTYGIMKDWAPEAAETMHQYYTKAEQLLRDPEALKDGVVSVATKAKNVVKAGFDKVCQFFGVSDAGENVKKVKKGSKNIVRTTQGNTKTKTKLTPKMQTVFTSVYEQAEQNYSFLKRGLLK